MTRCPKCDAELEVQGADPDVGIMSAGAYCDACDLAVDVEDECYEDDVMIFGSGSTVMSHLCSKCRVPLEMSYGLAGGGMGPYMYCPSCSEVSQKSQDPTL